MGSSPSSPVRDVTEKFWVPPAVIERKRAQSLVPALSHHDSDDAKDPVHFEQCVATKADESVSKGHYKGHTCLGFGKQDLCKTTMEN